MNINLLAIDIAKECFHFRAVNHAGRALLNSKMNRQRVLETVLSMPKGTRVVMEACGGAHYWGRTFMEYGYEVNLIAPQFVKPFVKSQKNDRADAEAIAEAASRDCMRYVAVKTIEQQDLQSLHRVRARLIKNMTQLSNETRGLLAEYGYVMPQGIAALRRNVPKILASGELSCTFSSLLRELYDELMQLAQRLDKCTAQLRQFAKNNITCKRLQHIPGIGLITATALYARVGTASGQFKNGRAFAASLGLVPRQYSTGGKTKLGKISKRGDKYLRSLLVHGARSVIKVANNYCDAYRLWVKKLRASKGYNKAAVAIANRNARIAWALLAKQEDFLLERAVQPQLVH